MHDLILLDMLKFAVPASKERVSQLWNYLEESLQQKNAGNVKCDCDICFLVVLFVVFCIVSLQLFCLCLFACLFVCLLCYVFVFVLVFVHLLNSRYIVSNMVQYYMGVRGYPFSVFFTMSWEQSEARCVTICSLIQHIISSYCNVEETLY
jgi:hypothetical protein